MSQVWVPIRCLRAWSYGIPLYAVLSLYLDDSRDYQDPQDKRYMVVGGAIGTEEAWTALEHDWSAIFAREGVRWLHMKELVPGCGEYASWKNDEERKGKFLAELLRGLPERDIFPIGCVQDFRAYGKKRNRKDTTERNPYQTAFGVSIQLGVELTAAREERTYTVQDLLAADDISTIIPPDAGDKIQVIAADKPGEVGEMHDVYHQLGEHNPRLLGSLTISCSPRKQRKNSHTCNCKGIHELIPLQCADLIAYELGQRFERGKERDVYKMLLSAKRFFFFVNEAVHWNGHRYVRDDETPIISGERKR